MQYFLGKVLIIMGLFAAIGSVFGAGSGISGSYGVLSEVRYSPGYSDMAGASYNTVLKKDSDGNWIMEVREREYHSAPTHITTYSVSSEDEASFEDFIRDKKVCDLQNRKDSDDFVTDYSPWGWRLEFEDSSSDHKTREYCDIREYKKYSNSDMELIGELRQYFLSLKGEKLSERDEN
ncbi:MAG: hypothetical protein IK152_04415 [Lachnospiraceae bacterium]|nr:hypothetical protein [Lachnospiraceae bacterium]